MIIGISGARSLTESQTSQLEAYLLKMPQSDCDVWHIGDANGVDRVAREWARRNSISTQFHNAISHQPWALQQRSKQLVNRLAIDGGELWAFPVQECPIELSPQHCKSWKGAGTWGTVAYAVSQSVVVHVMPLAPVAIPAWCGQRQISLF